MRRGDLVLVKKTTFEARHLVNQIHRVGAADTGHMFGYNIGIWCPLNWTIYWFKPEWLELVYEA